MGISGQRKGRNNKSFAYEAIAIESSDSTDCATCLTEKMQLPAQSQWLHAHRTNNWQFVNFAWILAVKRKMCEFSFTQCNIRAKCAIMGFCCFSFTIILFLFIFLVNVVAFVSVDIFRYFQMWFHWGCGAAIRCGTDRFEIMDREYRRLSKIERHEHFCQLSYAMN